MISSGYNTSEEAASWMEKVINATENKEVYRELYK